MLVVTLLEVSKREEGVVALHLPIGLLKTKKSAMACELNTYQPISHCAIGAGETSTLLSIKI